MDDMKAGVLDGIKAGVPEGSSVLLYSGGLDSYALAAMLRPDVLLTVDTGTGYGNAEQMRLRVPLGLEHRLVRMRLRDLGQFERRGDLILPGRNAVLVLLAANYGDKIMLAATAGDRVKDKDETFRDRMNSVLRHLYSPQWWLPEGRPVELLLPLKHLTKRRIVATYLAAGLDGDALSAGSFSCYRPTDPGEVGVPGECGDCKPCRRKWVALVLNGITPHFDGEDGVIRAVEDDFESGEWARGGDEHLDMVEALDLWNGKK